MFVWSHCEETCLALLQFLIADSGEVGMFSNVMLRLAADILVSAKFLFSNQFIDLRLYATLQTS